MVKGYGISRDQLIVHLLSEPGLMSILEERYGTFSISSVTKEFLKRDLKELKQSSLDLAHYSSLILQLKDIGKLELQLIIHYFTRSWMPNSKDMD